MKLHLDNESFNNLITLTAQRVGISEEFIRRDYFITLILKRLTESNFSHKCVFKGGTSLSKCYPGSIERFSEDIDLSYIPNLNETDNNIEKNLKSIESILAQDCSEFVKISEERNKRNKSSFVYFGSVRVKLEIGSNVRPEPNELKTIKTYIQEFLEFSNQNETLIRFELGAININTLKIERTFLDKIFAIKRHALCGSLAKKTRHIYDVVRLVQLEEIREFLVQKNELKELIQITKQTDYFYFEKRGNEFPYNPKTNFDFHSWIEYLDVNIRRQYESLHESLLFTKDKQDFDKALSILEWINEIFIEIDE